MTMNADFRHTAILLVSGLLFSCTAVAASNERGEGREQVGGESRDSVAGDNKVHFDERQRVVVRNYFVEESRAGRCPPGLAKKNNGCSPPGQVKQWQLGQQLPAEVSWYELSRELELQLGQAPAGYRYAGVDNDILLLELGTQVVVDVIQALNE
jgi:Ni/Co efflux regulator RcnB